MGNVVNLGAARGLSEDAWEQMALDVLGELAWQPMPGTAIAPGTGQRASWDELLIVPRLRAAIAKFNPQLPPHVVEQAVEIVTTAGSTDAIAENRVIHGYLTEGLRKISYVDDTGVEVTPTIRLLSTEPDDNDWLAVNQVTVIRGDYQRRFDIVLYLNGMPVSIIELKNAGSEHAGLVEAHAQLNTYVREFPLAFGFAVFALVSDGITASYGTPFTAYNHFSPWNVDDDGAPVTPENSAPGTSPRYCAARALQPGTLPAAAAQLHRLRPGRGGAGQADRQAAPVLRGRQGRRLDGARGGIGRQGRRRLAHPGFRQVDGNGAVRQPGDPAPQAGQPHHRRHHRPQRARRAAVRDVRPFTAAARTAAAGTQA